MESGAWTRKQAAPFLWRCRPRSQSTSSRRRSSALEKRVPEVPEVFSLLPLKSFLSILHLHASGSSSQNCDADLCCMITRKLLLEALEEAAPQESRVMNYHYYSSSSSSSSSCCCCCCCCCCCDDNYYYVYYRYHYFSTSGAATTTSGFWHLTEDEEHQDDVGPAAVQEVFLISDVDIQFFGEVPHVTRSPHT